MDAVAGNLKPDHADNAWRVEDVASLAQALGSPIDLAPLGSLTELIGQGAPDSAVGVEALLGRFREKLLHSVELPAIRDAFDHAARGEVRELLELDRRLAAHYGESAFREASRHAGRIQLRRLRPLRDRTLQRYLEAVESGHAAGWHVVVYGLMLALFSLPLRQGLLHYASKTQASLIESAMLGLKLSAPERSRLRENRAGSSAVAVQGLLPAFAPALA